MRVAVHRALSSFMVFVGQGIVGTHSLPRCFPSYEFDGRRRQYNHNRMQKAPMTIRIISMLIGGLIGLGMSGVYAEDSPAVKEASPTIKARLTKDTIQGP